VKNARISFKEGHLIGAPVEAYTCDFDTDKGALRAVMQIS
jgi:hypothetical protein